MKPIPPHFNTLARKFSYALFFLASLSLTHCASVTSSEFDSLLKQQPQLIRVLPEPSSAIEAQPEFTLEFSQRISVKSIHSNSVTLIKGPIDSQFFEDTHELMKALEDGELSTIPCQYFLAANEQILTLSPENSLEEDVYYLIVTPYLQSVEELPFNYKLGESPTAFLAPYGLGAGAQLLPSFSEDGVLQPTYGPEPEFLVLNEVLYDGKVSDTDGENFIELFGSPHADISDYFISLVNGSNGEETDQILLPLGSTLNEAGIFVIADLKTNSSNETQVAIFDYLDQFDPQNGPDAIQLFDRNGKLLDALWYGEGSIPQTPDGLPLGEGGPALDVGGGMSLSRLDGADTNDNSVDFMEMTDPSPGFL